jgi:hypothetical protein
MNFSDRYYLNDSLGLTKNIQMKFRFLLFPILLISLESAAQLNGLWRAGADFDAFDDKRTYEMPNGNLLVARMDTYNGIGDGNDLVVCFNPDGEELWSYGDVSIENVTFSNVVDIDFDSNSNVYLSGTYFPWNASYPKSQVTKLSASGEILWVADFTQQSDWSESAFQIEVTEDDRIFLLAQLYYEPISTLSTYFVEIDSNGDVLTMIPDPEYQIGSGTLMDFNDGFLYAIDATFITKLDYDGEVVWTTEFEFDPQFTSGFTYDGAEKLVQYKDGKIYACLGLTDTNTNNLYIGIAVVTTSGGPEQSIDYSILPDLAGLYYTYPMYLNIDSDNNLYATGTLFYGEGGIVRNANEEMGANRGGKGGNTYSGTFVVKIGSDFQQQWVSTYLEDEIDGVHYPYGTFLNGDQVAVVYNKGLFQSNLQKVVQYNSSNGSISWEHIEMNTDVFQTSIVGSSLLASSGHLYTCGSGYSVVDFENVSGIYLYKYAIDGVGISENIENSTVRVYPNPANDQVSISGIEPGSYLNVYNAVGQLCYSERITTSQTMMDVQSWSAGMYQINIVGTSIETLTLVKN